MLGITTRFKREKNSRMNRIFLITNIICNNSDESNSRIFRETHHYSFIHSVNPDPYLLTLLIPDIISLHNFFQRLYPVTLTIVALYNAEFVLVCGDYETP